MVDADEGMHTVFTSSPNHCQKTGRLVDGVEHYPSFALLYQFAIRMLAGSGGLIAYSITRYRSSIIPVFGIYIYRCPAGDEGAGINV
jgi:hypothetical protein